MNQHDPIVASHVYPKQPVEADEMVHVHVRDEHVSNAQ